MCRRALADRVGALSRLSRCGGGDPPSSPPALGAAVSVMSSGKTPQSQDLQIRSCGLVAWPRPRASCLGLWATARVPSLLRGSLRYGPPTEWVCWATCLLNVGHSPIPSPAARLRTRYVSCPLHLPVPRAVGLGVRTAFAFHHHCWSTGCCRCLFRRVRLWWTADASLAMGGGT